MIALAGLAAAVAGLAAVFASLLVEDGVRAVSLFAAGIAAVAVANAVLG